MSRVYDLTAKELEIALKLNEIKQEATQAVKKIKEAYRCFGIKQEKIEVWSDVHNAEYLTYDGVWQARYLHETYDVECTVERVYELLKLEYLMQIGEMEMDYQIDGTVRNFRSFINRIQLTEDQAKGTGGYLRTPVEEDIA